MEGDDLAGRGTEAGLGMSAEAGLAAVGSISPSAADILFVNEEMAHPAQDLSFDVPMRASDLFGSGEVVDGIAESAIVLPNFRTRWRYTSSVLFAWSRRSLESMSKGLKEMILSNLLFLVQK